MAPYNLAEEGGVKRHAFHLAEELRRCGDEVWILGSSSKPLHFPYVCTLGGVVNVNSNGAANSMGILSPPWSVKRFLDQHAFDVIHIHEPLVPSVPYYALWLAARAARVATFHCYAEPEREARARQAARRLLRPMLRMFDRGIAVSETAARYARLSWSRPLAVIPNGVSTRVYTSDAPSVDDPTRPCRLFFVGHWRYRRKGLGCLLEAYRRVTESGVRLTLDVIGSGDGKPPPAMPGLTFHGAISSEARLAEHYRNADIFVATSTGQESFGIVLLEAMAAGRPVICSDIEGYREVVHPEGARLVPPGNVDALASEIARLAQHRDAWRSMSEVNRRRAEEFDWARVTRRVRAEYAAAIEVRRARQMKSTAHGL